MTKIVLNRNFGGFRIPDAILEEMGVAWYDDSMDVRTNPILIDYIKRHPSETDLVIATLPDGYTDTYIINYDGLETMLYVLDGKIYKTTMTK